MSGLNKVLSVEGLVDKSRFYFKNRAKSILIIRTFFKEVLKIIAEGNEVRFPKKGNGKIYLVVKDMNMSGVMKMRYIGAKTTPHFLDGRIKPIVYGFDVASVRTVSDDAKFSLRFSYPRGTIKNLQYLLANKRLIGKLPEIK